MDFKVGLTLALPGKAFIGIHLHHGVGTILLTFQKKKKIPNDFLPLHIGEEFLLLEKIIGSIPPLEIADHEFSTF